MSRKKSLQILALLVCLLCLLCPLGAVAAEAYANYTPSNTTLTFYYDNLRSTRTGTTYDLNTGNENPGWFTSTVYSNATRVVFDPSFADARPTKTAMWFCKMKKLQSITGMREYLNTSEVTHMGGMFLECEKLTSIDLRGFNTAKVTNMAMMFGSCRMLTSLDLSHFNTAKVTDMNSMFGICSSLTSLDLSSFNTSQVTTMSAMFYECSSLTDINLSSFNTARVTDMNAMFGYCESLKTIYVGNGWSTASVTSSADMFFMCFSLVGSMGTVYDDDHADAAYAHIDGGSANPGYLSGPAEAYACFTSENGTLSFYYDGQRGIRTGTTYDLNTGSNNPGWYEQGQTLTRAVFDPSFADARPTTTARWFYDLTHLQSITGIQYLNTEDVTNMAEMFRFCINLSSLDVSSFNTAKVTSMYNMFFQCSKLTNLDVSGFNTSNVKNMSGMFYKCEGLTSLDLSNFNTASVTTMSNMLYTCSSLVNLELRNFNTAKVTTMSSMFANCTSLRSLDLGSFNTAKVTNMDYMFKGCSKLGIIYAGSDWSTAAVTTSTNMFQGCSVLVGGMGTLYSSSRIDATYAHIDGGDVNPGYFTDAEAWLRGDVNRDGRVNISDVTALIDYLLSGNACGINLQAADCNMDNLVMISDVTALIDFLLLPPQLDYYIVGNAPFGGWDPGVGAKMTRNADGSYSYTATIKGSVWFVFASGLDSDWSVFNSQYRFGPIGGYDETIPANTWKGTQRQFSSMGAYKFTGEGNEYVFTFIPDAGISPRTAKFMIEDDAILTIGVP